MKGRNFALIGLLPALLLLGGCMPPEEYRQRYFWPFPPEEPRLEYIGFYQADDDLKRGGRSWLETVVLGIEPAKPLFVQPYDLVSDGRGRLFVSDVGRRQVLILDLMERKVRFPRPDKKKDWLFYNIPFALAVDDQGRLFVSEMGTGKIFRFGADEQVEITFGGDVLERGTGLAVDSQRGRLYVADSPASRIAIFSLDGEFLGYRGERGRGPGQFNFPLDLEVDAQGNLYVLDALNFRVQVFDPEGKFLRSFGEIGMGTGGFQLPKAIAVDRSGHVYVTDARANRFLIFDLQGNLLLAVGGRGMVTEKGVVPGGLSLPSGIDADGNDSIWVADTLNQVVHRYQFLNPAFLSEHPIREEDVYVPRGGR